MAKTMETKTETTAETAKTSAKATALLRKGTLAYIGLYGAAYERAKTRYANLRTRTDGLFDTLVEKGEVVEAQVGAYTKKRQVKALETYATTTDKVRSFLPSSANDRVEALEAEIASLNKKVKTLSKKAKTPAAKAADKTDSNVVPVKGLMKNPAAKKPRTACTGLPGA